MTIKLLKRWPKRDKTEVIFDVWYSEYSDEVDDEVDVTIIQTSMHKVDTVSLVENELHELIKVLQEVAAAVPDAKVKAKKEWDTLQIKLKIKKKGD